MSERRTPGPQDAPATAAKKSRGTSQKLRDAFTPARALMLALVAIAVVLIAENTRQVKIRLLVPVVTMPLYAALLIMFLIGAAAGALLVHSRSRRSGGGGGGAGSGPRP